MPIMTTRNYTVNDLPLLAEFFSRYQAAIPDAKLAPPELYTYHPGADNGANVFCAMDDSGTMCGFAPVFPAPCDDATPLTEPHHLWTVILADPGLEADAATQIRAALLERVVARARTLADGFPPGHAVRLASDLMASQRPEIDFLLGQGFELYETVHIMRCDLTEPLLDSPQPTGVTIRRWRMETESEQDAYLAAYNRCLPANAKDRAALQFFMQSSGWAKGTAIAAFDAAGNLVASILASPHEEGGFGMTDDVFVLPEWRGRGLAKYLVNAGLAYLREIGLSQAILEVLANNAPAVHVYQATGHKIINQEVLLGKWLLAPTGGSPPERTYVEKPESSQKKCDK